MKLIILMGVSGSGKTSFRKEYIAKNPETKVISMDDIRLDVMHDVNDQSNNNIVAHKAHLLLLNHFKNKESIIWDNTTLSRKYMNNILKYLPENYELEVKFTEASINPAKCFENIQKELLQGVNRSNVPLCVIKKQADKLYIVLQSIRHEPINVVMIPEF